MPRIPITDSAGITVELDVSDQSDAARLGLTHLFSSTVTFAQAANEPLDRPSFQSAMLGGDYRAPERKVAEGVALAVKSGVNTRLRVIRTAEEAEEIELPWQAGEVWVAFGVDVTLKLSAGLTTVAGFGITGAASTVHSATTYTRFAGHMPSLREAMEAAISNFRIIHSADKLRKQPPNTAFEWEVTGKFLVEGSYAYPFAVNAFTLATGKLPLDHVLTVAPDFEMQLSGTLGVSGEFRTRLYRANESSARIGLYKKKQTELVADFTAKAGLTGAVGATDLISVLFRALGSNKFDLAELAEADREALSDSVASAIAQGLSIALNLECSAVRADEAAVLYEVELTVNTDAAIDQALAGNWTALDTSPQAKKLRTLLVNTRETGFAATLNLLGLYDYASIDDFVRVCSILHNLEDGTVTITDRESAQRITAAAEPFVADEQKLRKVLEESFLATAVYTAASANVTVRAEQRLLIYRAQQRFASLRKDLRLGRALRLLDEKDLDGISAQPQVRFYRLAASATFGGDDALRLFFADPSTRTPYREDELKRLGRSVLLSLLDENDPADAARIEALRSDSTWGEMEKQHFPASSPASYSDWYDIAHWSNAIAAVAPKLKATIEARAAAVGDPSTNAPFMKARTALATALAEVTRATHAAFERGWPIAVMFALSGYRAPVALEAQWNGAKQIDRRSGQVLRAV